MNKGASLQLQVSLGTLAIGPTPTLAQHVTKTLQYDPLGRLVSSNVSGGQGDGYTSEPRYSDQDLSAVDF
jgi:YD repeat-containing protein